MLEITLTVYGRVKRNIAQNLINLELNPCLLGLQNDSEGDELFPINEIKE